MRRAAWLALSCGLLMLSILIGNEPGLIAWGGAVAIGATGGLIISRKVL